MTVLGRQFLCVHGLHIEGLELLRLTYLCLLERAFGGNAKLPPPSQVWHESQSLEAARIIDRMLLSLSAEMDEASRRMAVLEACTVPLPLAASYPCSNLKADALLSRLMRVVIFVEAS